MKLATLRVASRMRLLIALTMIGLIVLCGVSLSGLRSSMLNERKLQTRHLVENGVGVVKHFLQLAKSGAMSEADARKSAAEALRAMRYDKGNYLFVVDNNARYILFPARPEREGSDAATMKDTNGKLIMKELIGAATAGGGYVDYWFPKAGGTESLPKISYALGVPEWGWVIGTGIYIDDVDTEFREIALVLGGISLLVLGALGLFGWRVSASVTTQLGGEPRTATAVMQQAADGDLTASLADSNSGSMLHALGSMMLSLRRMVGEINSGANQLVSNADHITQVSSQVAEAAERQSDATAAMAAAMEELTVSSGHISDSARETEKNAQESMRLAAAGTERVNQAVSAIRKMSETVIGASERIRAL